VKQHQARGDGACQVQNHLNEISPDDRLHSALKRIDNHQRHNHDDRGALRGAERRPDHQRDGGNAHTLGQRPRDQERRRRCSLDPRSKSFFNKLVGGVKIAFQIAREEQQHDDDATRQKSKHKLQERQVPGEGQRWRPDNGERGGFRGDD